MPLAEERLNEKVPFDVYAVMLIVTFLLTLGAILMLNEDLRKNWFGAETPGTAHAEHLTKLNAQTEEQRATNGQSEWPQVTDTDKTDYEALTKQQLKTPEYPGWLDPNAAGVNFTKEIKEPGGFDMNKVPPEERESMKSSYTPTDPTAGVMEETPNP